MISKSKEFVITAGTVKCWFYSHLSHVEILLDNSSDSKAGISCAVSGF